MAEIGWLIFDVEAVADGDLIARVCYPKEALTPAEAIARKRQTAFGEERMVLLEAEAACAHLLQPTPQDLQTLFPDLEAQLKALTTPPQRPDA